MSDHGLELVSCGDDGVRLWNASGRLLGSSAGPARPFHAAAWYSSGKMLAAACESGVVEHFLTGSLAHLSVVGAAGPAATALDISSGSRFLIVGGADGGVSMWDMKSRAVEMRFDEPGGKAVVGISVQQSAESRYFASGAGRSVSVYSRNSRRLVNRFGMEGGVTVVAFSPLRFNLLVAADNSGGVTVWDISRVAPLATGDAGPQEDAPVLGRVRGGNAPATDVSFSGSVTAGYAFCVSGLDKTLRFFSLEGDKVRQVYTFACPSPLTAVSVAAGLGGALVAAGAVSGSVRIYRVKKDVSGLRCSLVADVGNAHTAPEKVGEGINTFSPAVRSLKFRPIQEKVLPRSVSAKGGSGAVQKNAGQRSEPLRSGNTLPSGIGSAVSPPMMATRAVSRDSDIFSPPAAASSFTRVQTEVHAPMSAMESAKLFDEEELFGSEDDIPSSEIPSARMMSGAERRVESARSQSFLSPGTDYASVGGSGRADGGRVAPRSAGAQESGRRGSFHDSGQNNLGSSPSRGVKSVGDFLEITGAGGMDRLPPSSVNGSLRSLADANRRRLPPLPPRSCSDDAMAAHLETPPSGFANAMAKTPSPQAESTGKFVRTKSMLKSTGGVPAALVSSPSAAASARRTIGHATTNTLDGVSLKEMIKLGVESSLSNVRDDIKNLQVQLVLSLSRQEELFRDLVESKDKRILALEKAGRDLRAENKQLRGLARQGAPDALPVPDWMK